ncbi:hypothetical protein [Mycolicibacterium celeriflavum]|uniref:Uncharacterized protein n=1 Tax=Mycolicibacterium celeriflavum TaxID=1249101 RepID=A0A1X0BKE9_MYCCF|nr:hypothetical protein [Mycolicibacterium celeriflavum]MCV7240952.1 hypothetical protein [Mycolicibacterium celeriflavum]ORA42794.1 hypothetical protein BST21_22955 [Mycolicibacterium celeriflavum]BBY44194.1 hypothetical protein MCEL_24890 [Mycolicibacterium celeriflavum]
MTREFGDEGALGDLPWASVFDPAANARALSAIQAEGFRAASQIVDRFVRLARPDGESATTADAVPGAPDLERLSRAWWSVAGQLLLGNGSAREVELDLSSPGGQQGVVLAAPIPGRAETVVWLHNRTEKDYGRIRLRCSDLLARDGSVIGSGEVALNPHVVEMPAKCSRGIDVALEVSEASQPGVYRGTMLVDADDNLWLPVALTLRAPQS